MNRIVRVICAAILVLLTTGETARAKVYLSTTTLPLELSSRTTFGSGYISDLGYKSTQASTASRVSAPTLHTFVDFVVGDLNSYWGIPAPDGKPYVRANQQWITSSQSFMCGGRAATTDVAAYCSSSATIYLSLPYFQQLWMAANDMAIVIIIAHEFGHHFQRSINLETRHFPAPKDKELQADCLAGNYLRNSDGLYPVQGDGVHQVARALYEAGDSSGVHWFDPHAHGSGDERVRALVRGFLLGTTCAEYVQGYRGGGFED